MSCSIAACSCALPEHYYTQEELLNSLEQLWGQRHFNVERLRRFHQNLNIQGRHLAQPSSFYFEEHDFGTRNRVFQKVGLELAERCVGSLLAQQGLAPADISHIFFTTVTGLAVPSLEARLMNRLAFASHLKRSPLFGLGCLGGAAGLARAFDYLKGAPDENVLLLSVELCSLTLQAGDLSVPNLISSGLFGDGAAAVLLKGENLASQGPQILASRSIFFPNSEQVMGWEFESSGFQIVLSPQVPHYASHHLAPAIVQFLEDFGLGLGDVATWIAHPGGPKVIEALGQGLNLPSEAFQATIDSLNEVGNLSSASVLFVLDKALRNPPQQGYGLLLAMGPAFCAEVLLLRWS